MAPTTERPSSSATTSASTTRAAASASTDTVPLEPSVTASLFYEDGSFFGGALVPTPEPSTLALPCYAKALQTNPRLAGWLYVEVNLTSHVTKLGKSSPLPASLTDCIVLATRALQQPDAYQIGPTVVYFSLAARPVGQASQ